MSTIKIFVADTRHAHVFEMPSPTGTLRKITTLENPYTGKHERDLGADAPGRRMSRAGGGLRVTALEGRTTLKQHATELFVKLLARSLSGEARTPGVKGVVLIASPRLMGLLEAQLPKTVQKRIVAQIRRDLVDVPRLELQKRVKTAVQKAALTTL